MKYSKYATIAGDLQASYDRYFILKGDVVRTGRNLTILYDIGRKRMNPTEGSELSNASTARKAPRILHVLEATLGGTLRYLKNIIQALPPGSFDLGLAYSTGRADADLNSTIETARGMGWQVFALEMTRQISPVKDLRAVHALRNIIREYKPQIVHCHSSKAGAVGRLACFGFGSSPNVIYSPHAIAANLGRKYLYAEKLLRTITDRFAAVSDGERDELVSLGLASHREVDVIYPLIDTDFYQPQNRVSARAALGLPEKTDLIIGIGRLTAQKDPHFFCRVIRRLIDERKPVTAVWLGDGALRATMEELIHDLDLNGVVTMPGWKPDVRPFLSAADLLLSSSQYESFGYMVAEAMAMERPVVATAVSGTIDIMSNGMGELLYPVGDVEAAALRVTQLLDNPRRACELGLQGRVNVSERFSQARMKSALTTCYQSVLAAR